MKKYLIALDLDGTLLNNESLIPKETENYLKQLKDDGHKIVIATGRPYRGTIDFYNQLELNTPMITDNGALISSLNDSSFTTYSKTINKKYIDDIFTFIDDNLVTGFFSVYDELYVDNHIKELEFFYHLNEDTIINEGPLNNSNHPEPHLILFGIKPGIQDELEKYIVELTNGELALRNWFADEETIIYEIFTNKCTKATAVNKVAKHYNISKEDIISFGDGSNDIELLKEAGLGVKMINGSKRVTVYDDLTKVDNHSQGVMHYLKTIVKI